MVKILLVEDSAAKQEAVMSLLLDYCPGCEVTHSATIVEAEREIANTIWDLVLLDISMDIAPSMLGPKNRGQANIGGLALAHRMFLLDREAPTIIITAFDSFAASPTGYAGAEILGFEEVQSRAKAVLGDRLIACLQYNSSGWKIEMIEAVRKAIG